MADVLVVEVRLWGEQMGAVAPLRGKPGYYEFEYAPAFVRCGVSPSPIKMPPSIGTRYSFPALSLDTYRGLPGLIADSLPDRFGNALIDEYLSRHGIKVEDVTSLQRLLYVGRRAMGALEFEPAMSTAATGEAAVPLQIAALVEDARRALHGEVSKVTQHILDVGSSAGGARAKALIGWNPQTRGVLSGQFALPPGFEHWLLKFDGVAYGGHLGMTRGFGRIEYAHYLMARECGITMSDCALLEEGGRAHFMSRRFDRRGNEKLHVQTLCAMQHLDFNIPYVSSYEQYFRSVLQLNLGAQALRQAWMRCVFNVMARNCDDHTKNLAFIMNAAGTWSLSPAYDMSFSHNPGADKWTRQHQMLVNGKAQHITRADLMLVAKQFDIDGAKALLDQIADVLRQWPRYAREVDVPESEISRIVGLQQLHE
jgi:serine/threonine-protein kinase HipA